LVQEIAKGQQKGLNACKIVLPRTNTGVQAMLIVPIGKVLLQVPDVEVPDLALQVMDNIALALPSIIGQMLNKHLEMEITRFLGRGQYQRRRRAKRKETPVKCSKCQSRERQKFWRNGYYSRGLVTKYGHTQIGMPQLKCACGGNVRFDFRTLRMRQRFGADVQVFVQKEYQAGQSYRQIRTKLEECLHSSVGLRTLNKQVLAVGEGAKTGQTWEKGDAPPVVRFDGIWLTVMFETGEVRRDQLGRARPVKQAKKIPILAAQGVWPATGHTKLIAWMQADGEDEKSWQTFLERLWESGLTPENGLKLVVSDGGTGFEAAYQNVYWSVLRQRCVFHKLQNLSHALKLAQDLDPQAKKNFATAFLRSASRIWQADDKTQAIHLYQTFCEQWQTTQPKAVQTLQRDFEATLAFYDAQEYAETKGEHWPAHFLRTTSPLERMFREFRRRFRQAVLFHSNAGLHATTAQIATRFS
jgi:transposase-like protein